MIRLRVDHHAGALATQFMCVLLLLSSVAVADAAPEAKAPAQAAPSDVRGLPLIEVKQTKVSTDELGIFISGDGGWWTLDKTVSESLAARGIPVIGVSSYRHFAKARTPESVAADVARILRHYLGAWKKERVVLMGYSFGAEIVPFLPTRLPEDLRARVAAVVMIGPSKETTFEFHATDWVHTPAGRKTYPVLPEIEKLYDGPKLICTTSDHDADCICDKLDASKVDMISRQGNHHYDGDFRGLADAIWDALNDTK